MRKTVGMKARILLPTYFSICSCPSRCPSCCVLQPAYLVPSHLGAKFEFLGAMTGHIVRAARIRAPQQRPFHLAPLDDESAPGVKSASRRRIRGVRHGSFEHVGA